ncbi:hypothetical protein ACTN5O_001285 [Campylobacter jejuni]
MNSDDIQKYISKNILDWNFDFVEELYDKYLKQHLILQKQYCLFLYQVGKYSKLKDILLKYDLDECDVRYFNDKLSSIPYDIDFMQEQQYHSPSYACYVLNNKLLEDNLSHKECYDILYNILLDPKKNHWAKLADIGANDISCSYFIRKTLDYFFTKNNKDFLLKSENSYTALLQFLAKREFSGAKKYYCLLIEQLSRYYILQENNKKEPKFAICVSGALRGNWESSLANLKKVLSDFNADYFLFSWDKTYLWSSIFDIPRWAQRRFAKVFNYMRLPELDIEEFENFKKNFPSVYFKLSKDIKRDIDIKQHLVLSNMFVKYLLEDEIEFEKEYFLDGSYKEKLGMFVNIHKMFYGKYKAFKLIQQYENENNITYDYIIALRPDIDYANIKQEYFLNLSYNEILAKHEFSPANGILGFFYAGHRNAMEKMITIYEAMLLEKIDKFKDYRSRKINDQYFLQYWMYLHNLKVVEYDIRCEIWNSIASNTGVCPNITMELKQDLNNLHNSRIYSEKQLHDINRFFYLAKEKYPIFYGTAKSRIQNQLSYKLGQAMIVNSKSFLGYIRMPFVLSYIKDKHKQEQKIYQEKIKKDPSLKLPPLEDYPDYQEALKLKNHLYYKLGQALIQANKTWYGGGVYQVVV